MKFFEDEVKNAQFIKSNLMGPSALLILEELLSKLNLNKNMRILDLGCGTGLTSMYLAKKTGAQIYAADLWINPSDNLKRFKQVGLEGQIIPLRIDATQPMPFADEYFDAVISIDAYFYFGTGEDFLDKSLTPLVKEGGIIAIGIPGIRGDADAQTIEKMTPYLRGETNFHTKDWWQALWQKAKDAEVLEAFCMACHKAAWQEWLSDDNPLAKDDREMMAADDGKFFDTIGLTAKVVRTASSAKPKPWTSILK